MGRRPAGSSPRGRVRPRYGRIVSAVTSVAVTGVAVLGAAGLLPSASATSTGGGPAGQTRSGVTADATPAFDPTMTTPRERGATAASPAAASGVPPTDALPPDSGSGRRVVFSMSAQRVWLVGAGGRVQRTYLVSGSLTDNLDAGTYQVYSRSRKAVGIDDSGTMNYMVRFTHGSRAAIGFHDIPVDDGRRVQTRAELGTPQSHGCIRQWRPDARALWDFAPVGTTVVVTA